VRAAEAWCEGPEGDQEEGPAEGAEEDVEALGEEEEHRGTGGGEVGRLREVGAQRKV
jgi:hypothetical protein